VALGLAAGGGMYFAAGISTAIILIILSDIKPLEEACRARVQSCVLHMRAERGVLTADQLKKVLGVRAAQVRRLHANPAGDDLEDTTIHLVRVSRAEIRAGADRLRDQPGGSNVGKATRRFKTGACSGP
jgi:putative Mg2+ transporter-C (MgtC) family protein